MSQASNHVTWCINKANKEIKECKTLGKHLKHRGLLEINADVKKAKDHINKSEHNLKAVRKFNQVGFSDWSITAGFYSIYHCFLAIAVKFGYESRNQTCTIALIEHLNEQGKINVPQKFIDMIKYEEAEERHESTIIEMREEYTYGIETSVKDSEEIDLLVKNCQDMIDLTKQIVYGNQFNE